MENEHPTGRELSDFVQYHLTVDRARWVGRHLRVCAECNAQYRESFQGPNAPEIKLETAAEISSSSR